MTDVITQVSGLVSKPTNDWQQAVRRINEAGALNVRDICLVLGNPVGGVIGEAQPAVEKAYRNATAS